MRSLEGQVALITGAGSNGIGRAAALALGRAGADIAVHSKADSEIAVSLVKEIRGIGRRAELFVADFRDPIVTRKMVADVDDAFNGLDILVSNAATTVRKPALETSDAEMSEIVAVNLFGTFACTQEAALRMKRRGRGRGRIIVVSSVNQNLVVEGQVAYCASKGGVAQMAKTLALELAGTGITVNLIAPGTIKTDINRHLLDEVSFRELRTAPIPMKRIGLPNDIAEAIVFFAGSGADYVTGATLTIDGGLSLT